MLGMLRALWQYRDFVLSSIRSEFLTRFARSRLGGLWMIIHPLTQVAIFALILSNVLAAKLPGIDNKYSYAIYLMAGCLAWSLFAEIVSRCLTLFIEQGNLMKKVRFPRITLPSIVVGSSLLNNVLLFVAMLVIFTLLGQPPSLAMFWLVPLTLAVVALGVGVGLILGVLNVFARDVGQVVPVVLQILYWFTPIVYPLSIVPDELKAVIAWNPLYPVVAAYHDILVFQTAPRVADVALIAIVAGGLVLLGLFMFRRASHEMVDSL
jgi:lipopolysaccharide transport system permease protein